MRKGELYTVIDPVTKKTEGVVKLCEKRNDFDGKYKYQVWKVKYLDDPTGEVFLRMVFLTHKIVSTFKKVKRNLEEKIADVFKALPKIEFCPT